MVSKMIERLSDSPYSHIAVLARWNDRVLAFQSDMGGVQVLPASRIVYKYDGSVDWWALKPELRQSVFAEERLFDTALTLLGLKYGYWRLMALAFRIVLGRALNPKDAHATPDTLFCSQFVSLCYRTASDDVLDVNRDVNDESTSPADFARSGFFEPICRLYDGSGGRAGGNLLEKVPVWEGSTTRRSRLGVRTWTGEDSIAPSKVTQVPAALTSGTKPEPPR
jgi:hypothetical protein